MDMNRAQHESLHGNARDRRLYASKAAADFLGIHRSTLHLAVRRLKIVPDAYTPGGHARFRQETLERFSDRLSLDSATGGDGSMSRALASAVASLSRFTSLQPVCEAVVDAVLTACPGFEVCVVTACDEDSQRDSGWRLLAERGLPQRVTTQYRWLRRQPNAEFICDNVMRQGARFICGDMLTTDVAIPEGSLKTLLANGFRSCAALPCVADGQSLGLLMCLGRVPRDFSEPEIILLGQLADIVTVALRRWRRDEATRRQTETIGALMRQAREAGECAPGKDSLAYLRATCQQGAKAKVVRECGFATEPDAETPPALARLLRAAAAENAPQRAEWIDDGGHAVALATPASSGHAAVGAIWRRQDMRSGMEIAVLQVYAQAYSEIANRWQYDVGWARSS